MCNDGCLKKTLKKEIFMMKGKKLSINISRFLAVVMSLSLFASVTEPVYAAEDDGGQIVAGEADVNDPYYREDPGLGAVPIEITAPTNEWTARKPLDYRVPADFAGGTFKMIPYPFADSEGKADVLQINYAHNGKSTFGGMSIQSPLDPAVEVPEGATIEFDVYYPKSAQGKFMRWRIRNAGSDLDTYMRGYDYNNLNPDWVGSYNSETWLKTHHSITASKGMSSNFILELHGENARPAETSMLLVSDIKITAPDPEGIPLPNVVNSENQSEVAPLKSVYNTDNGLFMVGAIGTGPVTGTRARHYEIFVDGNNLKAESTHPNGPNWLKDVNGQALNGASTAPGLDEYRFPTGSYQAIRDSGNPGEYKCHGHVLAWYNQAPAWMRQMVPASLPAGYTGTAEFYGLGNGVTNTVPVDKEMARRVQFNHTMYVMRHFLTTDTKYGSSEERGVIPFHSWDVLNEEVHESRHSELIPQDVNNWRTSLKHTNWLVAMSDDEITGDITDHYIYLLFKYAHIAAPNAQMAEAYKANYADLPEYMKLDGHDNGGSIDAYVMEETPKLTYNDYGTATRSKARTIYNMVKELNTAWLSDPLYDGRPLIEVIGFQGHDSVNKTLASDNQYAMALYASLIDQGLLSSMSYSEFDLKLLTDAPGGGATAPTVLNVRQSDALGYQYALMYKLFARFAPYIDHIISWGVAGSGWQGSYVLFDEKSNANAGYYGAMDPDRFIKGHSYLDEYFDGEYEKLQDGYVIDLGNLGIYIPKSSYKAELKKAVDEAKALDSRLYTEKTYAVLAEKLTAAEKVLNDNKATKPQAEEALKALNQAVADLWEDPYFRTDPGLGAVPIEITAPTNEWTARKPLDNRVPADFAGGTYKMIPYPFADSEGKEDVLQINYVHNGTSVFGGMSIESPLDPAVEVPEGATIEFDVYYPKSAQGKYMRWRIRNARSDLDSYLRGYEYNNLNPDWVGSYNNETWLKTHHSITASTGMSSNFILELHGETSRPAETGMLLVANIKITAPDPEGVPLPNVVNHENQSEVAPLKSVYNTDNGLFMVGAIGTGPVTGTRARHYEIFVDGNNLKAESTHPNGPNWLKDVNGQALNGASTAPGLDEYRFPTGSYQAIRDSGNPGEYKCHGHVLAWYNQAPAWMRQMVPASLPAGYTGTAEFYGLGNGVTNTVPVDKEMARRVQFNHTMYVMRHFLTTDTKYGSSEERGVIPFHSWDVLNEEVHESRHSELIPQDVNNWRTSLKHTNWLVAMSDDEITGDITDHYIYLLFKYAHIAAPNAQMAEAYKANYADLPEYMKLDGHDNGGSIDAYVMEETPKLTYNDYGTATRSKARTIYNMVKELNTAWLSDPLYDGRPLIEVIGFQGHDSVNKTLASDNQYALALYASLIDEGLLSGLSFSEFDLKLLTDAPGGGATAPAALNIRQSDALGYQYALMYKLFARFAPYIDHIISWGVAGSGWQGSYVLFDEKGNANAGYYGAMDPDRFIKGHSYLDEYFDGEYEKLQDGYAIDLGDLGTYIPGVNTNSYKKELQALYDTNLDRDESKYTTETWNIFKAAMDEALKALNDPQADRGRVDKVSRMLAEAADGLILRAGDKSRLLEKLEAVKALNPGDYTPESYEKAAAAIQAAEDVLADIDAVSEEVDAALAALEEAVDQLEAVTPLDRTRLKLAIAAARALDKSKYTQESFAAVEKALAEAQALMGGDVSGGDVSGGDVSGGDVSGGDVTGGDAGITQEMIDRAAEALQAAIDALEEIQAVDTSALKSALDQAKALDSEKYTPESFEILKRAIEAAEAALADENVSQEAVDAAMKALAEAVNGLVEKPAPGPDDGSQDEGSDEPDTPSAGDQNEPDTVIVKSPKTYDNTHAGSMMVLAVSALCACLLFLKKRKENE